MGTYDPSKHYRSHEYLNNELLRQLDKFNANLSKMTGGGGPAAETVVVDTASVVDRLEQVRNALESNDATTQSRIDAMKVRISASVDALRTEQASRDAEAVEAIGRVAASVDGLESQTLALLGAMNRVADAVDTLEAQQVALISAVQAPAPDLFESRVRAGAQAVYNTGLQAIAVAGNMRISISNPSTSNRLVWLDRIIMGHTATVALTGEMRFGPGLTGTPLTTLTALAGKNMRPGATSDSPLQIRTDFNPSTALAGGAGTPVAFILAASQRTTLNDNLLALPPGVEMGINLRFAGAANAVLQLIVHTEPV